MDSATLYTIGHSNQPVEHLIDLLRQHGIAVLIDVRSAPYSRFAPQFNRETLKASIDDAGLRYVYAGDYLGGRPEAPTCYDERGQIDYQRVAKHDFYQVGIARLLDYVVTAPTAIMCSEEDPSQCHRHKLVAQTVLERGLPVLHIRGDGRLEPAQPLAVQGRLFD